MNIHPSAVIHPDAQIGRNVRIGPYAVIEAGSRIGDGCTIHAHAYIAHAVIGADNVIGHGAIIGTDPQDLSFRAETESFVTIGDRNTIREYCTLHRGTAPGSATTVGDHCFLMAGVHLGHNVRLGNRVIIANNTLLGGHVSIADAVFIGGGSVFHQHVRVGRLVMCQGMTGLSKNVPPFTLTALHNQVAGLNVIGLRRAGLSSPERAEIKRAFDLFYRRGLNTAQALQAAEKERWNPLGEEFFGFIRESKPRGICALIASRPEETATD